MQLACSALLPCFSFPALRFSSESTGNSYFLIMLILCPELLPMCMLLLLLLLLQVIKSLRFSGVPVPRDYEIRFQMVLWVFRHQRVYCPRRR